jgi:calcineurin-like phosphoesterase family protein
MIYFTSDWHLYDERYSLLGRPFTSQEEFQSELRRLWEMQIGEDDLVYIVGDITTDPSKPWAEFVRSLPGRKILVRGNYDRDLDPEEMASCFERVIEEGDGCEEILPLPDGRQIPLWITHYPTRSKPTHYNAVAHVHGSWRTCKNMLNVGIDPNMMMPLSMDRVAFLFQGTESFYDDDVWVENHPANLAHADRGAKGSRCP